MTGWGVTPKEVFLLLLFTPDIKRGEVLCFSISKASLCANAHTWNLINLPAHLSERRNCKNTVPSASALQTPMNSNFLLFGVI